MERVFKKDVGKRFVRGMVKDYPITTWNNIANSADAELDDFSMPVSELANEFKGDDDAKVERNITRSTAKGPTTYFS